MNPPAVNRRAALGMLAAPWLGSAQAHDGLGPVSPPLPAPPLPLTLHDGRHTRLPVLLQGRVTALQLMFTTCSATCPLQGAVFAALQARMGTAAPSAQLLSVTIDPLNDDARALAQWRRRFQAGPNWLAAAPPVRHADVLLDLVQGRSRGASAGDRHTPQVFVFDARGRLAFKCAELATPADIAAALAGVARQG